MALGGAAVRILPWVFDPAVSARVVVPFARSVGAVALEAAILVGWPVGWSLAAARMADRGEARALRALGEPPLMTAARLVPQALLWMALLGAISFFGARGANAPGRVVRDLLEQARTSCAAVQSPSERAVPFASVTWLCEPGRPPRLAGHGPGALQRVAFTASGASIAGDLRQLTLSDARVAFGSVRLSSGRLTVRGLTPWAHAADLGPPWRALLLALTGGGAALTAVALALSGLCRRPIAAIALGAAGPVAALLTLRALERAGAPVAGYAVVLPAALGAAASVAALFSRLPRLPARSATASQ
jgi:hypothetical protein